MNLCQDGLLLVKEAIRTKDSPKIPPYREDLVRNTLLEVKHLSSKKIQPEMVTAIHYAAIQRSKRCVLAYQRDRLDRFMDSFWASGASTASEIPDGSLLAANHHEAQFLKEFQNLVTDWKGEWLDIDLGISLDVLPREMFVEIRVLKDCGEVMTESGPILLTQGTQRYIKRADVEDLIIAGHVVVV